MLLLIVFTKLPRYSYLRYLIINGQVLTWYHSPDAQVPGRYNTGTWAHVVFK